MTAAEVRDWVDRILGDTDEEEATHLERVLTHHVVREMARDNVPDPQGAFNELLRLYSSRACR